MPWLLDTNILSELRRPRSEQKVVSFVADHPLRELYVSAVTLAELRFGIYLLNQGSVHRAQLEDWLTQTIRPMFDQRILPITENIVLRWRILLEQGRKSGHTYSQPDLLIAATALEHGFTVVTRDRSDYEKAGVPVFNPWTGS